MLLNSENPKHKTADCGIPGYNLKVPADCKVLIK